MAHNIKSLGSLTEWPFKATRGLLEIPSEKRASWAHCMFHAS
jgi:hypothetical protein